MGKYLLDPDIGEQMQILTSSEHLKIRFETAPESRLINIESRILID